MEFKYTKAWEDELLGLYKAIDEAGERGAEAYEEMVANIRVNPDKWESEVLKLYESVGAEENDWGERLDKLIAMAWGCNDVRVVKVFIRCLAIEGSDSTLEGALEEIDPKVYYEGVFQIIVQYLDFQTEKNHGDYFAMEILSRGYAWNPDKSVLENDIFPIAKKNLPIEEMKKFISYMENNGCPEDEDDCDEPQRSFYNFFKKTVEEAENE